MWSQQAYEIVEIEFQPIEFWTNLCENPDPDQDENISPEVSWKVDIFPPNIGNELNYCINEAYNDCNNQNEVAFQQISNVDKRILHFCANTNLTQDVFVKGRAFLQGPNGQNDNCIFETDIDLCNATDTAFTLIQDSIMLGLDTILIHRTLGSGSSCDFT